MKHLKVNIKGMHCRSCELLVEDELLKIKGIDSVIVSQKQGCAIIKYHKGIEKREIGDAIKKAGYEIGIKENKPLFTKDLDDYTTFIMFSALILVLFFLGNNFGLFNFTVSGGGSYSSLPFVLLIGLTAGISTCMALVGGLVLGASARYSELHPNATTLQKFKPHIFFNLGRVLSFFIFGGLIGYAGSLFQLTPTMLGILTIVTGIVMLIIGVQLTEIMPKLSSFNFTLPKILSKTLKIQDHSKKEYSHKNSIILGGLTFFLPCGFTQAMQLFAISTGSFLTGSLTMGIFAIGTMPGLIGLGGLTSLIKGVYAKMFFKFVGVVVMFLALFNISNGFNLTGLNLSVIPKNNVSAETNSIDTVIENGVQILKMDQLTDGYKPDHFKVKQGIPVKWIINSYGSYSCSSVIVAQDLGIKKSLVKGENIIEFTPQKEGDINFSCIMGMFRGVITVVKNTETNLPENIPIISKAVENIKIVEKPEEKSIQKILTDTQMLKATYTKVADIQPKSFTVKINKPVRFELDVKDSGTGCMGTMAFPGLSDQIEVLTKGKTLIFEFTPKEKGNFSITCAMGVPRGEIKVI